MQFKSSVKNDSQGVKEKLCSVDVMLTLFHRTTVLLFPCVFLYFICLLYKEYKFAVLLTRAFELESISNEVLLTLFQFSAWIRRTRRLG